MYSQDLSDDFTDYVNHVNILQGTNSDIDFSRGNCLPIVARPFGMVHWSLQTNAGRWFFHPSSRKLQGIRATHQPSPWMGDYGGFTVMPQTGEMILDAGDRASAFSLDQSTLSPHYLSIDLKRYGVQVEFTPTERGGVFRFTFPKDKGNRIILEQFAGDGRVEIHRNRQLICGYSRHNSGGVPENFAHYFAAIFDQPYTLANPTLDNRIIEDSAAHEGDAVGAVAEFDSNTVIMRVCTSFISAERAVKNIIREINTRDFDTMKEIAESVWNRNLGRIHVSMPTEKQLSTFYTCYYRTLLFPRMMYEFGDHGQVSHYSPYDGEVHKGPLYTDNGFWDTYRTVYPLLSITQPERVGEILEGYVNAYQEGGWFPQWPSPGYRSCMSGTYIDTVFADAYMKGIRDYDVNLALAGLLRHTTETVEENSPFGRVGLDQYNTLGYVASDSYNHATSRTLDYAYNDWCIAQIAQGQGKAETAERLLQRAQNYRNVFDKSSGFMRGRKSNGEWEEEFSEYRWGGPFIEGSSWQHTFAAPHDPEGLAELKGGKNALIAKLDQMLAEKPSFETGSYRKEIHEMTEMALADFGQYAHSNQPVHHVLYLYAVLGAPEKTQYWVRRVMDELYSPMSLPGDEDNGEMSAWYVLSALGIYPLCPGKPAYVLGSPLVTHAEITLSQGNTLTINAPENSRENVYVKGITVDGTAHENAWIEHETLMQDTVIEFAMGSE